MATAMTYKIHSGQVGDKSDSASYFPGIDFNHFFHFQLQFRKVINGYYKSVSTKYANTWNSTF